MFERSTMARVLPFAAYMSFLAVGSLLEALKFSDMEMRWLYPLKIATVIALLWYYRRDYTELRGSEARMSMANWGLALVVGVLVFVAWINLHAGWMVIGGKGKVLDWRGAGGALDWGLIAVRWCGAALVVPLMEELFWRSFIMRWIANQQFLTVDPAKVGAMAFVVTAALFASEHSLIFAGFVAGVAYNFLYCKSRSLWSPILAHAVTNGILGGWVLLTGNWSYW